MFNVPLLTRMPSPPVLRMVTLETPNVKAELAATGLTRMAMPLVATLLPSNVSGAAGLPAIDEPLLIRRKAPRVAGAHRVHQDGDRDRPVVVSWTLVGRTMGNVSPPGPR